jgi:hypothetical protein
MDSIKITSDCNNSHISKSNTNTIKVTDNEHIR